MEPNPDFADQRRAALKSFARADIDPPIREVMQAVNRLPWCFSLQCCWGHFVTAQNPDQHNLARLTPDTPDQTCHYRISYLALCLDTGPDARDMLEEMRAVPDALGPDLAQFGCAEWFWKQWVNSYVLQVQPRAMAHLDSMDLGLEQALQVQEARDRFWPMIGNLAALRAV